MSFSSKLISNFGSSNLYEIFGVEKDVKDGQLKRAYYKLCLKYHPDRVDGTSSDKKVAEERFKLIAEVYALLGDKDKRSIYDQTGKVNFDDVAFDAENLFSFLNRNTTKITVSDIENFFATYRGSEEEKNDLMSAYEKHRGSINDIMEDMFCDTNEDEERYTSMIADAISEGAVKLYDAFKLDSKKSKMKRKKKRMQEALEAEQEKSRLGLNDSIHNESSLKELILSKRSNDFDSLISNLTEKYTKQPGRKSSNKSRKRIKTKK